ncbi:MAG: hypothetical protein ACO307_11525 [Ilumatobacteraceae bacterium]
MDRDLEWSSTVVLGDGSSALLRPITPADADALAAFHLRQAPESRYYRYFSPKPSLTEDELQRFTTVDFVADAPGAFALDCTEFCSALHLEMQGWVMVTP